MSQESVIIGEGAEIFSSVKIIDINEDLGCYAAADLRKILDELVNQKIQKIIVNLSQVSTY